MKINNQQEININRRQIESCLNRMEITNDMAVINEQCCNLMFYISQHASINKTRLMIEDGTLNEVFKKEYYGGDINVKNIR